jgi:MORN repeat
MGEYSDNMMDGYGVYIWKNGTIYRGQWENSMQQGCGVKITKQPNGQFLAEEGEFVNDEWVGSVMGCSVAESRRAAAQADTAAQMAAVFELSQPAAAAVANAQPQPQGSLPILHRKKGEGFKSIKLPNLDEPIKFVQGLLEKVKLPEKIKFPTFDKK